MGRRTVAVTSALLLVAAPARAYRPFVSSDGAVAEERSVDVELGVFQAERRDGFDAYDVPTLLVAYGAREDMEVVAEVDAVHAPDSRLQAYEPQLSLKSVLKDGFLQQKPGVSLAQEAGLLLPATGDDGRRFGFEESGILSAQAGPAVFHLNLGGGVERSLSLPFAAYGLIAEMPASKTLRFVGELNGEAVNTLTPANSGLVGAIWTPGWRGAAFDAGWRRGLSAEAAPWSVTAGVTFSFRPGGERKTD